MTGNIVYITTTTTTTTIVNAPIIVVAAPITTTINTTTASTNTSTSGGTTRDEAGQRLVMDLTGCGRGDRPSGTAGRSRVRRAHARLAANATLVVRVNGKPVTTVRLPSTASGRARGVPLRVRLAPDGMLTIRRPSGLVVAVQGCVAA